MRFIPIIHLAVFLFAGIVAWAGATVLAGTIEAQSEISVRERLIEAGFDWAEVRADGLQVVLTGEAPSEAIRLQAISTAGQVVDSARIYDEMDVVRADAPPPPQFSIEILRNDREIQLIGLVPGQEQSDALIAALEQQNQNYEMAPFLEVAEHEPPEQWSDAIEFAVSAVSLLPRSQISVTSGRVRVTAIATSPEERSRLEGRLITQAPDDVELLLNISSPRPVVSPFSLRFVLDDDGARFDACTSDTMARRAEIIRASRALGVEGRVDCVLGLGVPSSRWTEAVILSIQALGDIGGGTVTLTDADISLVAKIDTDATLFETRMGQLEAELPELFALNAVLPRSSDVPEDAPRLSLDKTADGLVQISGRMPDDLSRDAALNVAAAMFGTSNITSTLRVDPNVPEGWTLKVLNALQAMQHIHHGGFNLSEGELTLQGQTGDTEAREKITAILAQAIGEDESFSLDVTYNERYDPIARLMGPDECIAAIDETKGERKIGFEPGAASIDGATAALLDEIALVLRDCINVRLEIAGHTDSQGREEMNQALSQARAEAVLEELAARRVLTNAFVARGYGETTPIADNGTAEGRDANRRIEFVLLRTQEEQDENADDDTDTDEEVTE